MTLNYLFSRLRERPFAYLVRTGLELFCQRVAALLSTLRFRLKAPYYGVRLGRHLEVVGPVTLRVRGGRIMIGSGVQLISSSWRCTSAALNHPVRLRTYLPSSNIVIEDGVGLNGTSITCRSKTIRIGRGTMIGPNCIIMDSDFHRAWPPQDRRSYDGVDADADVSIGRDVWIGANCMILKGVSIGDNSVIAAGSVVVKGIPANVLAAGNPAIVKKSFVGPR